jgi:hypothetical protein
MDKISFCKINGCKYQLAAKGYVFDPDNPLYAKVPFIKGYSVKTKYIELKKDGRLILTDGYPWDGASGPAVDTDGAIAGSLYHDPIYKLIRMCLLPTSVRRQADKCYKRICRAWKMSRFRAWMHLRVLKKAGKYWAIPGDEKKVRVIKMELS